MCVCSVSLYIVSLSVFCLYVTFIFSSLCFMYCVCVCLFMSICNVFFFVRVFYVLSFVFASVCLYVVFCLRPCVLYTVFCVCLCVSICSVLSSSLCFIYCILCLPLCVYM